MRKQLSLAGGILFILLFCTNCATVINGTSQKIGISSTPSGASVVVDSAMIGITPLVADLKRGDTHVVKIQLSGYFPYEQVLTQSVGGAVWGNILLGGLIGLVVDASSGSMYNLSRPDSGDVAAYNCNESAAKTRSSKTNRRWRENTVCAI